MLAVAVVAGCGSGTGRNLYGLRPIVDCLHERHAEVYYAGDGRLWVRMTPADGFVRVHVFLTRAAARREFLSWASGVTLRRNVLFGPTQSSSYRGAAGCAQKKQLVSPDGVMEGASTMRVTVKGYVGSPAARVSGQHLEEWRTVGRARGIRTVTITRKHFTRRVRDFAVRVLDGAIGERYTGHAYVTCALRDGGSGGPIVRFTASTGEAYLVPASSCTNEPPFAFSVEVRSAHRTSFSVIVLAR